MRFELQPSLGLLKSDYPVFTVWFANQTENAPPVGQSTGSECGMVLPCDDGVEVRRLEPAIFSYISALLAGRSLAEAMTAAELDEPGLLIALRFLFSKKLVCAISSPP